MAIPKYDELMLPLLTFIGDGREYSKEEIYKALKDHFALEDAATSLMLPNGSQTVFANRVAWAKTYLRQAGLIVSPKRGWTQVAPRGQQVLAEKPAVIDKDYLRRFSDFMEFLKRSKASSKEIEVEALDVQTPEELLETSYRALQEDLAQELLDSLRKGSPSFFERVVVDLLVRMGYGGYTKDAGSPIGGPGDEGLDGIIKEDRLGLGVIYVQAKRWQGTVSRPEVQKFAGALQGKMAKKGVFITTSGFSQDAWDFVKHLDSKIALIDGAHLAKLMIEHDVGVTEVHVYRLKRVDSDYFIED